MRRLLAAVVVLTMIPMTSAFANDLDEILERSRSAEYSAEQIISCSTPDGVHDAFVQLVQSEGEIRVSSRVADGVEVAAGEGDWVLTSSDGLVSGASVDQAQEGAQSLYDVDDGGPVLFLGRAANVYQLQRDGELRAELVVDDRSGAIVRAVTFGSDGEVYCERRFVSINDARPESREVSPFTVEASEQTSVEDSDLPDNVAGFERLDHYEDEDGFSFAYYSDGFFSFALFETPSRVSLPDSTVVEYETGKYHRLYSAGQVSYAWETRDGGMALIGDLPPDLHEEVLSEMPQPDDRGLLRRWWRALFG